jgi:hypothetical protein
MFANVVTRRFRQLGGWRAKWLLDTVIIVAATFLAFQQYPPTRALALLALGRNRSGILAKAMGGDRGTCRKMLTDFIALRQNS